MKTKKTRSAKTQNYKTIGACFKEIDFNNLAMKSGFKKRKPKKIKGKSLIISFIIMALKGSNTFEMWAQELSLATKRTLSKQAICKRMTACFVNFVHLVLTKIFSQHIEQTCKKVKNSGKLKNFKNILVQDSTIICLPKCLSCCYPGNYSLGEIKALIKIQLIIELMSNKVVSFCITPYAKKDQSMSETIIDVAKQGDLVLRDLGYFSLHVFEQLKDKGISFISRIKSGVKIFDPKTGMEINLVRLLRKEKKMDRWVLVGKEQKLLLRIVALRLADEIANEKIRKEKKNRDKRLNHSNDYFELMRYNIYITTEHYSSLSTTKVAQVYTLRWRIETIFKTWKSNFHLQKLIVPNIKMTNERVESIIYLMLIFIMQFQLRIYNQVLGMHKTGSTIVNISITKLSKFIAERIKDILEISFSELIKYIDYYCRYDKRNDRKNYLQNLILS
ncbi:MAG: IS4 family transposase [Bacteroidota bacterium]